MKPLCEDTFPDGGAGFQGPGHLSGAETSENKRRRDDEEGKRCGEKMREGLLARSLQGTRHTHSHQDRTGEGQAFTPQCESGKETPPSLSK